MLSRGNNTLTLMVQTFSGLSREIWSLRGDHGNNWHQAEISLYPKENIMVMLSSNYVFCTFTEHCALLYCTLRTALVTALYIAHGELHAVRCEMHIAHCTLHCALHTALRTAHCALRLYRSA